MTGLNNSEASFYAGISQMTLYRYMDDNPDFVIKVEEWKQNPVMKAKKTLYENLHDPNVARWLLERKAKDEFTPRTEIKDVTQEDEAFIIIGEIIEGQRKEFRDKKDVKTIVPTIQDKW